MEDFSFLKWCSHSRRLQRKRTQQCVVLYHKQIYWLYPGDGENKNWTSPICVTSTKAVKSTTIFVGIFRYVCWHLASILRAFCGHFVGILRAFCGHFVGILQAFCRYFVGILWAFCEHVAGILWAFCGHFVGILWVFSPSILWKFSWRFSWMF